MQVLQVQGEGRVFCPLAKEGPRGPIAEVPRSVREVLDRSLLRGGDPREKPEEGSFLSQLSPHGGVHAGDLFFV